ncbi:hypothetical protein MMC16_000268 [Acarospora aff. strigata]|nr:hypothetical protein [Acarospora aff. strigata]
MRTILLVSALAGLAFTAPRPQELNFEEIDTAPVPSAVGPSIGAVEEPVTYNAAAEASEAAAAIATDPATPVKRSLGFNDDCGPQPDGYGPKTTPDTPEAFLASQELANIAISAPTPAGYKRSFQNLQAAVNANSYLGLTTFKTYDTIKCQQLCDATNLCTAFNIYIEREIQA